MKKTAKKITTAEVKTELERAANEYWERVSRLGDRVREDHIIPYCKKHGANFLSGSGTYHLYPGIGVTQSYNEDDLPKGIKEKLDFELIDQATCLGAFMEDFQEN